MQTGRTPQAANTAAKRALLLAAGLLAAAGAAAFGAEPGPANMPAILPDPSAGDWVVDRFAGNSTAGPAFLQGPAREAGGLGRCGACPLPDGRVLVPFPGGVAEVAPDGDLRLLTEASPLGGTTAQVTAGVLAWNPADRRVYAGGARCVTRLVEPDRGRPGALEVVAGTPGMAGFSDGPVQEATFTRVDSLVVDSRGTIYVLDDNRRIRRIRDGQVTTLTASVRSGGDRMDGPLAGARFALIGLGGNLCGGEDDDTLYLSDHWNYSVRRIDLRSMTVSTVAGMPRPRTTAEELQTPRERRYNRNSDGPALTWASFNSGCAYVCWDPVHHALWCGGPDESRFRWLGGDQVLTVIGARGADRWQRDALGVPGETVRLSWNAVVAVDAKGRAYLSASSDPHGLWRAYNVKESKP